MALPGVRVISLEDGLGILRSKGMDILENFLQDGILRDSTDEGKPCLFTNTAYSQLYSTVYQMATQKVPYNWAVQLYSYYGECIAAYCSKKVIPSLIQLRDRELLEEMLKKWENHKAYVKWMKRIFQYLDRYYVRLHSEPSLHDRGISIFRDLVFVAVRDQLRQATLTRIQESRDGHTTNQSLLKKTVDMYLDLSYDHCNIYATELEDYLLPATLDYYTRLSFKWLEDKSFAEYLKASEEALSAEDRNFGCFLCERSLDNVQRVVVNALLANPMDRLLNIGRPIHDVLRLGDEEGLRRPYRLFGLVEKGLAEIASEFKVFVLAEGNQLISRQITFTPNTPNSSLILFMHQIFTFHHKYKGIVQRCFSNDPLFQKAMKEAFEVCINRDGGDFGRQLCAFCNLILKKPTEGEQLFPPFLFASAQPPLEEEILNLLVELFNYITEKDAFAEKYRRALAKRLLYETSNSEASERAMIAKLRLKCGNQFTARLEGMINDLATAAEWQKKFSDFCLTHSADLGFIEFTAQVLHTGHWPAPPAASEVKLPSVMLKCTETFENFYKENGGQYRRLTWVHGLGNAVVAGLCFEKKHELICNTYQACLLFLFNYSESLSFSEVKEQLAIEDELAKKVIFSLTSGKFKILLGSNESKVEESIFTVNEQFTCGSRLVKVPSLQQEEQSNKEHIEEDRSVAIEAAIVRIMKAKKQLTHQQLVSDVLEQLSMFKPNPKVIKFGIEKLIEREFFERDTMNPGTYIYTA